MISIDVYRSNSRTFRLLLIEKMIIVSQIWTEKLQLCDIICFDLEMKLFTLALKTFDFSSNRLYAMFLYWMSLCLSDIYPFDRWFRFVLQKMFTWGFLLHPIWDIYYVSLLFYFHFHSFNKKCARKFARQTRV